MSKVRPALRAASWAAALAPVAVLGTMVLQALHLRAILGRWPVVYQDAPASPFVAVTDAVIYALFWLALAAPIAAPIGAALSAERRARAAALAAAAAVLGWAVLVAALSLDPTGYVDWFFD